MLRDPALKWRCRSRDVDTCIATDAFHTGAIPAMDGELESFLRQECDAKAARSVESASDYTYPGPFLAAGSARGDGASHGEDQLGFWTATSQHRPIIRYWAASGVDKIMAGLADARCRPVSSTAGSTMKTSQRPSFGSPPWRPGPEGEIFHCLLGPWKPRRLTAAHRARHSAISSSRANTAIWVRRTSCSPSWIIPEGRGPKPDTPRVLV